MSETNHPASVPTKGMLVLPFKEDNFRDFIIGLLGKPQRLNRIFHGSFDLTKEKVENIHHVLSQRMASQNKGGIVGTKITVGYSDSSSVEHSSIEQFMSYSEVRKVVSTSCNIVWTFLIQFETKDVPEKQEINLSFSVESAHFRIGQGVVIAPRILEDYGSGSVVLRISHTDRSWGVDVENLIGGLVKDLMHEEDGKVRKFVRDSAGWLGFGIAVFLIAAGLFAVNSYVNSVTQIYREKLASLRSEEFSGSGISSKVFDFAADIMVSGAWTKYSFYSFFVIAALIVFSILVGIFTSENASQRRPSFVLLSGGALRHQSKKLKELEHSWYKFLGAFALALIVGVLGNYAFAYAIKVVPV